MSTAFQPFARLRRHEAGEGHIEGRSEDGGGEGHRDGGRGEGVWKVERREEKSTPLLIPPKNKGSMEITMPLLGKPSSEITKHTIPYLKSCYKIK